MKTLLTQTEEIQSIWIDEEQLIVTFKKGAPAIFRHTQDSVKLSSMIENRMKSKRIRISSVNIHGEYVIKAYND